MFFDHHLVVRQHDGNAVFGLVEALINAWQLGLSSGARCNTPAL